jgi:ribA/ribD-fused uncharacterized protein
MGVYYVQGDLFLSAAQTLAHGVNCRGRMGAGVAVEFRRRAPDMYQEYRRRCHHGQLQPGELFLWTKTNPWILNLATQDTSGGARPEYVEACLQRLAADYTPLGITSLGMPRIAAGLGGLPWEQVRDLIERLLGGVTIPVFVYEQHVEGLKAGEPSFPSVPEEDVEPVVFGHTRRNAWREFSNFAATPITIDGKEYPTVEHYFQACKAATEWEHEMVRAAATPAEARQLGRTIRLRPDWEMVKEDVMTTGLLAKFEQYERLRELLLSTGARPLHEDSPHDVQWGWQDGAGQDRMGRLLEKVRTRLRSPG